MSLTNTTRTQIRSLYDGGTTAAADILTALSAETRHYGDTDSATLMNFLKNTFRVIKRNRNTGAWEGPLIDHANGLDLPNANEAALAEGIDQLLGNEAPTVSIRSNGDPHIGFLTTAICQVVGSLVDADANNPSTSTDVKEQVKSATGGVMYAEATVELITAEVTAYEAEIVAAARAADIQRATDHFAAITTGLVDARQAAYDAATPAINDARVHQSNAAASLADVDDLTDAELTARVDAVIATSDGVLA